MTSQRRDPSFLYIAAMAGTGGVLAIVCAIGFPAWALLHHRQQSPAFMLFAAWGLAALCGAVACVRTYFMSGTPSPPPRGGVALKLITNVDAKPKSIGGNDASDRAA